MIRLQPYVSVVSRKAIDTTKGNVSNANSNDNSVSISKLHILLRTSLQFPHSNNKRTSLHPP